MGLFAAALSAKVRDVEVRDMIGSINASVEALERLFSELMDISKLDSGAVAPSRSAFALAPLLRRIEREFAPLASAKQLRFRVVLTRAWVESDPVLLERIVANLAANAVRYTGRGGVVIGARPRSDRIAIEVWDSGVGIPAAERERIFEEFYQVGNAERHSSKGMGLGLATTRRLSALLAHPVRVDSAPGRGSRFTVIVPRASACSAAATTESSPLSATTPTGALIAVVDDEIAVIEGMRALFTECGALVVGAASGEAMLCALGEVGRYPDLIIADYRLAAGELGTDVVARVRNELGVPVPALLISGDLSTAALAAMRASGLDVLLKPVLPHELKAAAERLLARDTAAMDGALSGANRQAA